MSRKLSVDLRVPPLELRTPLAPNPPEFRVLARRFAVGPLLRSRESSGANSHGCHILPFQPILWNRCFPSKSVKSAQNSPKSISEWGKVWQVWLSRASSVYGQLSKVNTVSSKSLNSGLWRVRLKQNLKIEGRGSQAHFPEIYESTNLSRDNLSREIGRTVSSHDFDSQNSQLRVSDPRTIARFHFGAPFESSDLPAAGPTFPDSTSNSN